MLRSLLLASAAAVLATPAHADDTPPNPPAAATAPADSASDDNGQQANQGNEIIVTAPIEHSEQDVLAGTSVVSGEELTRDLKPTIGETLEHQPGVSATSFGPNASRPILRGFQGDRIRVLSDGIGSIDVSNTSADHAVIIDPLLAERIEVLRGPSALLFGSSAVGGVVNVIDRRIPRSVPEKGYRLDGIATYGSAANERSVAGAGDAAVGSHFVVHADASYTKSDDLHVGGYVLTPSARAAALAAAAGPTLPDDPDFAAAAALKDKLPNSGGETWTAGVGAALITDGGNIGVSYSHYDSLYGVPIRYATESGQEQEAPRLDVVQNRYDLRAEVDTGDGILKQIRLRAAAADYRHYELEEDGAIGTAFYNNGLEGRVELVQAKRGGWSGASGVQFFDRNFNVVGDEAFLPRNETVQTGFFTLQQFDFGGLKAEGGLRYETTSLDAKTLDGDLRFFGGKRDFQTLSGSLGASYGIADGWRIGVNLSRTARAPSAEELFANGPHAGTESYVLGNPDFRVEKSWGVEATLHGHSDVFNLDGSVYYNWFSNFIYDAQVSQSVCEAAAAPSGRDVDLPCFQNLQADARYYGAELDLSAKVAEIGGTTINVDGLGDYVHAEISGVGPAPRIPPLRVLGGIEAQSDKVNGRLEVEHVFDQHRLAAFETPTDGYTMVNASVALTPFNGNRTSFTLSANNLFDVDARRHSSYLKDFAPLAGRDIRLTVRLAI
ncbi:TonB-dependent receptor [Sphingomonas sp.]|uniref:TonB-dependent receptor n=1 Tax=Sphingomonas sp. TaxID=28214 RepID=UPI001B2CD40F|nr:TonB-dependent receptor [Sphingomonas sp.]MBO9714428.1 TonB-dependent receptor [Sphingomonas sp.]